MWNARLNKAQAGIKIVGRNSNNLRYADGTTLMAERKQRGTKEPLDGGERGEWKSWLKTHLSKNEDYGIQPHPITPWKTDGGEWKLRDFIFLGSKITADGDCSHEIKRCLLLERKAVTNLDSIVKSRDITLLTKVHLLKAMIFPVVMYGCVSWTIKKPESLWCKNWCFWTEVLEKTLESPLDSKEIKSVNPKGNQFWILIWKDWCWSWSSNTLATRCKELIHWKKPWC